MVVFYISSLVGRTIRGIEWNYVPPLGDIYTIEIDPPMNGHSKLEMSHNDLEPVGAAVSNKDRIEKEIYARECGKESERIMGMFDTILVPCPGCGEKYPAQSKSGDCKLVDYELNDAPRNVLCDVNRHAPFTCKTCGIVFEVRVVYHKPEVCSVRVDE